MGQGSGGGFPGGGFPSRSSFGGSMGGSPQQPMVAPPQQSGLAGIMGLFQALQAMQGGQNNPMQGYRSTYQAPPMRMPGVAPMQPQQAAPTMPMGMFQPPQNPFQVQPASMPSAPVQPPPLPSLDSYPSLYTPPPVAPVNPFDSYSTTYTPPVQQPAQMPTTPAATAPTPAAPVTNAPSQNLINQVGGEQQVQSWMPNAGLTWNSGISSTNPYDSDQYIATLRNSGGGD